MTREEEIIKASHLYAKALQKPFVDGAMWADEHPDLYSVTRKAIEREREHLIREACDWLKNDMIANLAFQGRLNRLEIIDGIVTKFRKAMEEQQ